MKMAPQQLVGLLVGVTVLALTLTASYVIIAYLTEYGIARIILAVAVVVAGLGVAAVAWQRIANRQMSRKRATISTALIVTLLAAPVCSMQLPGKITFSRFGLTVYGLVPAPVLDITVKANGLLWFRDKSHFISLAEVKKLLSPDLDALIIGTGWDGLVQVDPAVRDLPGVEVHIVLTPEAFKLFNQLKVQGKKVALIAHSTC